jgi:hypothetical protein
MKSLELNLVDLGMNFNATNSDGLVYGLSVVAYPIALVPRSASGLYFKWLGLGTSYKINFYSKEVYQFISVFPAMGEWAEMLGYCLSVEPMFNINQLCFDRVRFRGEVCVLLLTGSLYYDLVFYPKMDYRIGLTLGLGLPIPLNKIEI